MGGRQTTLRARTPRTATRSRSRRGDSAQSRGRSASRSRGGRSSSTSAAHITTDYDTIREWAGRRGGWPATVARTAKGEPAGILRIDFPGFSGEGTLKPISWDDWFDKFEESNLAFLFQEKTRDGKQSRFFKLIERE
jgi:hypothetical protein